MARKRNRHYIGYAQPSFLEGMARVLDFGGTLEEYDIPGLDDLLEGRTPDFGCSRESTEVIRQSWIQVGQYLYGAIGRFEAVEKGNLKAAGHADE